ncbi:MAG: helix-turn-helix transcriptional regulator, partial [Planctomycetota bacterium]
MQLMSIEDLAAYLGDSKRTIYKYIASGDCPPYIRISAKNIKFDRADVDAWLESKKVIPETAGVYWPRGSLPWTPRAKRVMKAAEQTARQYKLACVGTGEMLLGIVEVKDCLGATILGNLGIDRLKVRQLHERLQEG